MACSATFSQQGPNLFRARARNPLSSPDPPPPVKEDPAIAEERARQKQRAEEDKIRATQDQLKLETQQRNDNSGIASLFGSFGSRRLFTSLLGKG
jgi:hypothetical protein